MFMNWNTPDVHSPHLFCRFDAIITKIPLSSFIEINQLTIKFTLKFKRAGRVQTILKKNNISKLIVKLWKPMQGRTGKKKDTLKTGHSDHPRRIDSENS